MKSSILRTGVALACAVSLASCGGGNTGTLQLGGFISGVSVDGLVLQNNGGSDLAIPAGSTSFLFTNLVPTDSVYNVTIKAGTQPANVSGCVLSGNTGNTGVFSVTSIVVACTIFTHALTGTISGLTGSGLILINGANQVPVTPASSGTTTFAMAPVSQGFPYGITILAQPTGQTCTVVNGVGTEGTTDNNSIVVTCTNNA